MASEKCLFYFQGDPFSKCESESEFFFHLSWELEKNKSQDNLPMFLIIFFCENTLNIFYLDTIYILCVCNREGRKKSPGKFSTLSFTKEKNHIWKWKKKLLPVFFSLFLFPFFFVFTDGTWKNDLCKIFLTSSQVINTNEETISIRLGWITL